MALALKVKTSVPLLLVVTVPMVVAPTTKLPPWVSAPSVPVAENWSCEEGAAVAGQGERGAAEVVGSAELGVADRDVGVKHKPQRHPR